MIDLHKNKNLYRAFMSLINKNLTMYKLRFQILSIALLAVTIITSCKKDKMDSEFVPPTNVRNEQIKDSIFLYAKQVYFWYKNLPTYSAFNPRKFTGSTELEGYENELFALTRYPINPVTGRSYEYLESNPQYPKFSYIEDLVESGKITLKPQTHSSVDLNGKGSDFGLGLAYVG